MIITRTPLRISFFGGGTDLPAYYNAHGGAVLSVTMDKYQYITCRKLMPYWKHRHQFRYGSATEEVNDVSEIRHPSIRETMKYFQIGYGLDMHYNTDVPARSGLGSSSAFTVGFVNALYGMEGRMPTKRQLAADAIHIEQDLIGEAVGSQDQIAAAFGGLNYIEFKRDGGFFVHPVTISRERKLELESRLVLIFTGFQRFAVEIEAEKIRDLHAHEDSLRQMNDMVGEALSILTGGGDLNDFGRLLDHTWQLKKSLSRKVSTSAVDEIYQAGLDAGALGGKLLGAGGGGFMLFFCEPEKQNALAARLGNLLRIPFHFEENGSQVIYYRAED